MIAFSSLARALAIALLLALPVCAPAVAVDMQALQREAFAQWTRWIDSGDVERRRQAAESLGGYSDQPQAVTLLANALDDRDDQVRLHAASSLWQLADRATDIGAAQAALRAALDDPWPAVRVKAAGALEKSGVAAAELVAARRSVLRQGDWFDVALAARDLIGAVDASELVAPLLWSLREAPPSRDDERFDAGDVLQPLLQQGGSALAPALLAALDDPQLPKTALLAALGSLDPPPAGWQAALQRAAADPFAETRAAAASELRRLVERRSADEGWIAPLLPLLDDAYPAVREAACGLYAAAGGAAHPAVDALLRQVDDSDQSLRHCAVRALGAVGDAAEAYDRAIKASVAERATPRLQALAAATDAPADLRHAAETALAALRSGSASHTQVLQPRAAGDAAALARLRARDVEFTEDAFWRAIGDRDAVTVGDLLAAGIDADQLDASGMPALHLLLMSGCDYGQPTATATREIAGLLLAGGADPDQRDQHGDNTALHRASSCDAATVRQLLAAGADPHAVNASRLSAFTLFLVVNPEAAAALLAGGFRARGQDRSTLQAMLGNERDAGKRRLIQRALGQADGPE